MKDKKDSFLDLFLNLLRYIPFLAIIILIILVLFNFDKITVENILYFTPENPILAGFSILLLFIFKSICIFFPSAILYICSGRLFPFYLAIIINSLGLIINLSLPYFIGRFFGKSLYDRLLMKYPNITKLDDFKEDSPWFFVVISRLLKFIPGDVTSLVHGSMNIPFPTYLFFSFLVRTPPMLSNTFLGSGIKTHNLTGFFISTAFTWIISGSSIIYYYFKKKNKI